MCSKGGWRRSTAAPTSTLAPTGSDVALFAHTWWHKFCIDCEVREYSSIIVSLIAEDWYFPGMRAVWEDRCRGNSSRLIPSVDANAHTSFRSGLIFHARRPHVNTPTSTLFSQHTFLCYIHPHPRLPLSQPCSRRTPTAGRSSSTSLSSCCWRPTCVPSPAPSSREFGLSRVFLSKHLFSNPLRTHIGFVSCDTYNRDAARGVHGLGYCYQPVGACSVGCDSLLCSSKASEMGSRSLCHTCWGAFYIFSLDFMWGYIASSGMRYRRLSAHYSLPSSDPCSSGSTRVGVYDACVCRADSLAYQRDVSQGWERPKVWPVSRLNFSPESRATTTHENRADVDGDTPNPSTPSTYSQQARETMKRPILYFDLPSPMSALCSHFLTRPLSSRLTQISPIRTNSLSEVEYKGFSACSIYLGHVLEFVARFLFRPRLARAED